MHAWSGTVNNFLSIGEDYLINKLEAFEYKNNNIDSKKKAWIDSIRVLKKYFKNKDFFIDSLLIFEYLIPLSGGRRPDVLFIHNDKIYILEFKGYSKLTERDVIQCETYEKYFKFSSSFVFDFFMKVELLKISPGDDLHDFIEYSCPVGVNYTLDDFLNNKSISSLNLLSEFEEILNGGETEFSKGVSDNLDQVYWGIETLIQDAKQNKKHVLIFVNGLPGSGKTMLGLKLACLKNNESIYLSGNDSLIKVFRSKISKFTNEKSLDFIQYFKNFKKSVILRQPFHQNIFIFDEGQRAWSAQKVKNYYENKLDMLKPEIINNWRGKSEAHIFLDNLLLKDWAVGIILVGNNQEIYQGEEKGLSLWNEPFENSSQYKNIEVYTSGKNEDESLLKDVYKLKFNNNLYLNKNYRSYGNDLLYEWVDNVLNGNFNNSKEIKEKIKNKTSFFLKTTKNLDEAIKDAESFYPDVKGKTLGLLKSSGVNVPIKQGKNNYYISGDKSVIYFNGPDIKNEYCNNFRYMANEFECQGLELDFVIFYWGDELFYKDGGWKLKGDLDMDEEKLKLKLNAYRVLLTRAREGMIIVLPPEKYLKKC